MLTQRASAFICHRYGEDAKCNFFNPYLIEESPIWWYVVPEIINTFLESDEFYRKNNCFVYNFQRQWFCKTFNELKESVYSTTILKERKLLNGR